MSSHMRKPSGLSHLVQVDGMVAGVELGYDTSVSALQMVRTIFGKGLTVSSAPYSRSAFPVPNYSNGDTAGAGSYAQCNTIADKNTFDPALPIIDFTFDLGFDTRSHKF